MSWQKGTHTAEKAFYLGVVYRRLLNYPKAREFLEESLRLKPKNPEALRLLADTLLTIDKPDLARPLLQELEKTGYQPTQTAFLSGVAAAKLKRFDEAVDYFRKAQDDPTLGPEARVQMSKPWWPKTGSRKPRRPCKRSSPWLPNRMPRASPNDILQPWNAA